MPNSLWNNIWVKGLTPKISFFIYIVAHNVILTQDKLQKKGYQLENKCILCGATKETRDNIIIY